jgi:hypothetical protein
MGTQVKKLGDLDKSLSKLEIENLAHENSKSVIENKQYDLLRVYVELKRYELYLKNIIQKIKPHAVAKALEDGKKNIRVGNAIASLQSRTSWDFSLDEEWKKLNETILELTAKKKARESELKEMNIEGKLIDRETGELVRESDIPKEFSNNLIIKL